MTIENFYPFFFIFLFFLFFCVIFTVRDIRTLRLEKVKDNQGIRLFNICSRTFLIILITIDIPLSAFNWFTGIISRIYDWKYYHFTVLIGFCFIPLSVAAIMISRICEKHHRYNLAAISLLVSYLHASLVAYFTWQLMIF